MKFYLVTEGHWAGRKSLPPAGADITHSVLLKELRVAAATVKILFICGGSRLRGGECRARPLFPEARWGQASRPPQAVFWTAHIPRITAHGSHHQDRVCSGPVSGLKLERRVPSGPMAVITGVELAKKGSIQLCPGRQIKQTG